MEELRRRVQKNITDLHRRVRLAKRFVKYVLIIGGTACAGLAAFFGSDGGGAWTEPLSWTGDQLIGLVGVTLASLGSAFAYMTEENDAATIDAREALEKIDKQKADLDEGLKAIDDLTLALQELGSMYLAYSSARSVLERAVIERTTDETKLIVDCLWAMKTDLRLSLGFEMRDTWTICVYRREVDEDKHQAYLRCIANDRSIPCELDKARTWKEGVGVGGMALAKDSEVVAPDILANDAGTLFSINGDVVPDVDRKRYRSMCAVPVTVHGDEVPWGVVLASSNVPFHFGAAPGSDGLLQPEETVRQLAGIVALAVAVARQNNCSAPKAAVV